MVTRKEEQLHALLDGGSLSLEAVSAIDPELAEQMRQVPIYMRQGWLAEKFRNNVGGGGVALSSPAPYDPGIDPGYGMRGSAQAPLPVTTSPPSLPRPPLGGNVNNPWGLSPGGLDAIRRGGPPGLPIVSPPQKFGKNIVPIGGVGAGAGAGAGAATGAGAVIYGTVVLIQSVAKAIQQGHYKEDTSRAQEDLTNLFKKLEDDIAAAQDAGTLTPGDLQEAYDAASNSWTGLQQFLSEKGSAGQAGLKTMQWVPQWLADFAGGIDSFTSGGEPEEPGEPIIKKDGTPGVDKPPWWKGAITAGLGTLGGWLSGRRRTGGGAGAGAGGAGAGRAGGAGADTDVPPWWLDLLGVGAGAAGGAATASAGKLPGWVEDDLKYWMQRRKDQEAQAAEEYGGRFNPETGEFEPGARYKAGAAYEALAEQPDFQTGEVENLFYGPSERDSLFLQPSEQGGLHESPEAREARNYRDWEAMGLDPTEEAQKGYRFADWEALGMRETPEEAQAKLFTDKESGGLRYSEAQKQTQRISPEEEAGIMSTTLAPIAGSVNRARDELQRLSASRGTSAYGANIQRVEEEAQRQSAEAALRARLGIAEMRRAGERDIAQQDIYGTETAARQRILGTGQTAAQRIAANQEVAQTRIAATKLAEQQRIARTQEVARTRIAGSAEAERERRETVGDIATQRLNATQNILGQRIAGFQNARTERQARQLAATQGIERLANQDLDRQLSYSGQARIAPPMTQPSVLGGAVTGVVAGMTPILGDWRRKKTEKTPTNIYGSGFKYGGFVKKTGPALVHKGEFVIPQKEVRSLLAMAY